jgi:integration host factor subunit alpha
MIMAIRKASLTDSIYESYDCAKPLSATIVESPLELIKHTLASGEDILISGFGKFYVKDKNERRGRNPHTGNGLMLDARRVVKFKCSNIIRDKINAEE